MRYLILANRIDLGAALMRFLKFTETIYDGSLLTFTDLRMVSQDILNCDLVIVEAVNIEKDSLENRGVEFLLSFNRIGKRVLLFYIDARSVPLTDNLEQIMLKFPHDLPILKKRIQRLINCQPVVLNEKDKKVLDLMFPYKMVKDHHHHRREIMKDGR